MELLTEILLQEIEDALRRIALDPATTANPDDKAHAPLAVLV